LSLFTNEYGGRIEQMFIAVMEHIYGVMRKYTLSVILGRQPVDAEGAEAARGPRWCWGICGGGAG
jgi:hypothetical protein